jgi:carbamoyl-phosphate synthase large subunit
MWPGAADGHERSRTSTPSAGSTLVPEQIAGIIDTEAIRAERPAANRRNAAQLKAMGFSDARLASWPAPRCSTRAQAAQQLGVRPVYKRIDTCAAEFASPTPTCTRPTRPRSQALRPRSEAFPSDRKKVVILGGGPNRIGQGIEFDYCCCHAAFALAEAGYESIMVNCNPETVSTDYDTSDRLYFEPLTPKT